MSNLQNTELLRWAKYLDLYEDVKPWLQLPASNTTPDARLELIIDSACEWVQNFLGRPVAPTTFDRRFDGYTGWNGAYIELPYYPILEMISVTEWWGVSGPHVLIEQTPTSQTSQDAYQVDYLRGQVRRVFPGLVQRPWFPGSRNVEIVWTAGYNPLPADIKLATLEYVAAFWHDTQQGTGNRPPGSEYDIVAVGGPFAEINRRCVPLLEPYMQVGIG